MINMKNVINYYYNIELKEYKKRENCFTFYIGEIEFEFIEYYGDINYLIKIYSLLISFGKPVSEIVINKDNKFITHYESRPYILLKKINRDKQDINLEYVIDYDFIIPVREINNWKNLWIEKLDYYEIQQEEINLKYPLLNKSFSYYFGLTEAAINLLNYVNYEKISSCISHKRLDKKEDIFNPLNIIIDNRIRDVAEYIKTKFFKENIMVEEIIDFINKHLFSKDEILLLVSRLLYPSYYFDAYENIYKGEETEKELNKIIKKNVQYETFLRKIYKNIKLFYNIPQIEFLEN